MTCALRSRSLLTVLCPHGHGETDRARRLNRARLEMRRKEIGGETEALPGIAPG